MGIIQRKIYQIWPIAPKSDSCHFWSNTLNGKRQILSSKLWNTNQHWMLVLILPTQYEPYPTCFTDQLIYIGYSLSNQVVLKDMWTGERDFCVQFVKFFWLFWALFCDSSDCAPMFLVGVQHLSCNSILGNPLLRNLICQHGIDEGVLIKS